MKTCCKCHKLILDDVYYCYYCGRKVEVSNTSVKHNNKRTQIVLSSLLCLLVIVLIAGTVIISTIASRKGETNSDGYSNQEKTAEYVYKGTDNQVDVIAGPNMSGARLNLSLKEFSNKVSKVYNKNSLDLTGETINFDLNLLWGNMVEEIVDTENETGCTFTTYTAFFCKDSIIKNGFISVSIMDNLISSINIIISDCDNDELIKVLRFFEVTIAQSLFGFDLNEAEHFIDLISVAVETAARNDKSNGIIYYNGIMYYINASHTEYGTIDSSVSFCPASEEYIQKLIADGNCGILRYNSKDWYEDMIDTGGSNSEKTEIDNIDMENEHLSSVGDVFTGKMSFRDGEYPDALQIEITQIELQKYNVDVYYDGVQHIDNGIGETQGDVLLINGTDRQTGEKISGRIEKSTIDSSYSFFLSNGYYRSYVVEYYPEDSDVLQQSLDESVSVSEYQNIVVNNQTGIKLTDNLISALQSYTQNVLNRNIQNSWASWEHLTNSELVNAYLLTRKTDNFLIPENYAGVVLKNSVEIRPYDVNYSTFVDYYYSILIENIETNPDGSIVDKAYCNSEPTCTVHVSSGNGHNNYYNGYQSLDEFKSIVINPLLSDYEYSAFSPDTPNYPPEYGKTENLKAAQNFPDIQEGDVFKNNELHSVTITGKYSDQYSVEIYIVRATCLSNLTGIVSGNRLLIYSNDGNTSGYLEFNGADYTLVFENASYPIKSGSAFYGFKSAMNNTPTEISSVDLCGRWNCPTANDFYMIIDKNENGLISGNVYTWLDTIPFTGYISVDTGMSTGYTYGNYNISLDIYPQYDNGQINRLYIYYHIYDEQFNSLFGTTGDTYLIREE